MLAPPSLQALVGKHAAASQKEATRLVDIRRGEDGDQGEQEARVGSGPYQRY